MLTCDEGMCEVVVVAKYLAGQLVRALVCTLDMTLIEDKDMGDMGQVLGSNAPKSGSAADVKKWIDNLTKMHKEAFANKLSILQKLVKEATGGYPPWIGPWLIGTLCQFGHQEWCPVLAPACRLYRRSEHRRDQVSSHDLDLVRLQMQVLQQGKAQECCQEVGKAQAQIRFRNRP